MTKATLNKEVSVRKTAASAPKAEISQTQESSGPIWKTQHNRVQGAMWRHLQPDGKARFTVSVSRSYKDGDTNKWVNTHFFDERDLGDMVIVAHEAQDKILQLKGLVIVSGED